MPVLQLPFIMEDIMLCRIYSTVVPCHAQLTPLAHTWVLLGSVMLTAGISISAELFIIQQFPKMLVFPKSP